MIRFDPELLAKAGNDPLALKELTRHGSAEFPLQVYTNYSDSTQRETQHWHEEVELIWMPAPGGKVTVSGELIQNNKDALYFIHPGEIHAWSSVGKASQRTAAIVFRWRLVDLIGGLVRSKYILPLSTGMLRFPRVVFSEKGWGQKVCEEAVALITEFGSKAPGYELGAVAHLYTIMGLLASAGVYQERVPREAQKSNQKIARIKKAMQYVFDHYDSKISVSQLAKISGLSSYHFSRIFKAVTNQTPVSFINRYRVDRATELLKNTNKGILHISVETGFNHLSYFNKIFKRFYGSTPSEYRASFLP